MDKLKVLMLLGMLFLSQYGFIGLRVVHGMYSQEGGMVGSLASPAAVAGASPGAEERYYQSVTAM